MRTIHIFGGPTTHDLAIEEVGTGKLIRGVAHVEVHFDAFRHPYGMLTYADDTVEDVAVRFIRVDHVSRNSLQ